MYEHTHTRADTGVQAWARLCWDLKPLPSRGVHSGMVGTPPSLVLTQFPGPARPSLLGGRAVSAAGARRASRPDGGLGPTEARWASAGFPC